MQRERGGVAAGPQPDYASGLSVRKQRLHAKANREKGLVIMQSTGASLRHG